MSIRLALCAAAALVLTGGVARAAPTFATPLYFQGFESDTSGWNSGGGVTRTPSGSVPAFDGSYYGSVANLPDDYQLGYGTGGSSHLNGASTVYPGAGFSQSISIYIDPTTAAPANPSVPAFWLDMSPGSVTPDGVGCSGGSACSDEQNFQFYYDGSSVAVHSGAAAAFATITSQGWYTFQITYEKGASPTDLVNNELNIFDSSGNLVGSAAAQGNSDGAQLLSSNLGGPGYVWLTVWQNGFSNDKLAVDNLRADTLTAVPEPSAMALLATALFGLFGAGTVSRRRHSRS